MFYSEGFEKYPLRTQAMFEKSSPAERKLLAFSKEMDKVHKNMHPLALFEEGHLSGDKTVSKKLRSGCSKTMQEDAHADVCRVRLAIVLIDISLALRCKTREHIHKEQGRR